MISINSESDGGGGGGGGGSLLPFSEDSSFFSFCSIFNQSLEAAALKKKEEEERLAREEAYNRNVCRLCLEAINRDALTREKETDQQACEDICQEAIGHFNKKHAPYVYELVEAVSYVNVMDLGPVVSCELEGSVQNTRWK